MIQNQNDARYEHYDLVVLLCASALNESGRLFDELTVINGRSTYLGGQVRMEAAADFAPNVDAYIVVGGDHKDGKHKKINDMKSFLEKRFDELQLARRPKIIRLYSNTDTAGNLWALKRALRKAEKLDWLGNKRVAIMTSFYHLLRAMRFAADIFRDIDVRFVPISSEAAMYRHEATYAHHSDPTLARIMLELNGLRNWEQKKYTDKKGRRVQKLEESDWNSECLDEELLKSL